MAVASRTPKYDVAVELLKLYDWLDYFSCLQMFTDTKVKHINKISTELGIRDQREILFFDDEEKNIQETKSLGVTAFLLNTMQGLNVQACINGLKMHDMKFKK